MEQNIWALLDLQEQNTTYKLKNRDGTEYVSTGLMKNMKHHWLPKEQH